MKRIAIAIAATLLAGTAGLATAAGQMEGSRDIHSYQKAAGADVSTMPAGPMVDWQALDGHTLAVWTANDKPWLVNVDQSCMGLKSAKSVSFTSRGNQITAGTDSLKFGDTSCKVDSIRPVDYKQVASMHRHHMQRTGHMATNRHSSTRSGMDSQSPQDQKQPTGGK
ncbi:MAG: hypothetical protein J0H15_07330 [Xanthomonadales bacterium]|nr:hypothetical protein [Xanthomonadales bacterium]